MSKVLPASTLDNRILRDAYAHFPTGVVAVCGMVDGDPVGMVVSAFMPLSLEPPLLSVSIQHASTTWPTLCRAESLGVSVLGRSHRAHVRQLSAKHGNRFRGLEVAMTTAGAVMLPGVPIWFECHIHSTSEVGDHELVILMVDAICAQGRPDDPMVFHGSQFRELRPQTFISQ